MKTLLIHPEDPTTNFLSEIYKDRNWTIMRGGTNREVKFGIMEHDRIIMLGHGTKYGLIGGKNRLIINSNHVQFLRERFCVGIWCYANEFFQKYGLKGYSTGMIISEMGEAIQLGVPAKEEEISHSNAELSKALRTAIISDNFVGWAKHLYVGESKVHEFNRTNFYSHQ